jgi:hypothetical protein
VRISLDPFYLSLLTFFLAPGNIDQALDSNMHTVASSSFNVVPDSSVSMTVDPSVLSADQPSVDMGSIDSVSGMVAASSDPNLSSVNWDLDEALAWFNTSS